MDPDIGGIGVHLGLAILPWISIGTLIYGHSHGCESGAKELCMQNLAKLLTACASIDCVSAVVSMSFSDKRVLASRRLIHTCVLIQLLAFAVAAKALYGFRPSDQAMSDRCEFQMFWSVPFASSEGVPRGFWLHFAWRLLVWAHNAYLALLFAGPFHRAESISRKTLEEKLKDTSYSALNVPEQMDHALAEDPDQNHNIRSETVYLQYDFDRLPATVFTKYLEHAFTVLVASVSIHGLARDFDGKSKLLHMDWGQRTPFIVCLVGVIHFIYAQARNFGSNSLKHLWEVELVTGEYPNSPDHLDDYPPWARPTPAFAWSLRFLQHMWCVLTTQRRLSSLRALNFPRCGPIKLTGRLNPSWLDFWKNPFPKSVPLPVGLVQSETEKLWKQFDTLGSEGIREALLNGADINFIHDDENRTVLLRLLNNDHQCHTRIVALALLMGAETDVPLSETSSGILYLTPLDLASGRGHVNVVSYLLDHYPKIPDPATALISAARGGHNNIADLLVSRGLEVSVRCPSTGETALIAAARYGNFDTVHYLLDHDADCNARCSITGETALIATARSEHADTMRYLNGHGRSPHVRANRTGYRVLKASIKPGHEDVLRLLTSNDFGIDINAKSERGTECTNFHYTWSDNGRNTEPYAAAYGRDNDLITMVTTVRRNHKGDTALHRAACSSSLEALKILLDTKIDIEERTLSGDTALIVAIRDGDPALAADMVQLLLGKKPELASLRNHVGKSALDFCLERTPNGDETRPKNVRRDRPVENLNGDTAILEALLKYHKYNVVGLDWKKTWDCQIKQWEKMSWYPPLQAILKEPVGNSMWPIGQTWDIRYASEKRLHEVRENTPESPYIQLQLRSRETLQTLHVHRIVFRIVSNDQGWSDWPETQYSYTSSRTWFEAKIKKQNQQHDGFKRRICRNLHAVKKRQQHTVIWDERDETPTLKDWLGRIEAGDEIQVIPKASHGDWVNAFREAKIIVSFSWETAKK